MTVLLNDGRPLVVELDEREQPYGPLARLLVSAIVPHVGSTRAERGRRLAAEGRIHSVAIAEGRISARALGSEDREYELALGAEPIPRRVWRLVSSSSAGARLVEAMLAGSRQSVQLEHLLTVDWDAPLVPRRDELARSCTCPDSAWSGVCKHVAALAYVLAAAVDRDPSLLLRWRGCSLETHDAAGASPPTHPAAPQESGDPWEAGRLPDVGPTRGLPVGAVLKRLGPSGIEVDGRELAELLGPAYAAFASRRGA